LKPRGDVQIQMEILASLFASPKVVTRLCQSVNLNAMRLGKYMDPLLAKGLVAKRVDEGKEVYAITGEGYRLYKDWLDIWRRLSLE
jgi:predicted transcriptional regulator